MGNVINATLMMIVTGALLGLLLGFASKFLYVEVDPRIEAVHGMLPNYNCGACGMAGCGDMAEALVTGTVTKVSSCKASKQDAREKIVEYLTTTPGPDGECVKVTV